ncbi:hypothetical protein B9Z55_012517 [Caenorhabditis nigoni]|uniref:Uncharacterized protein n=1 Tax=Caenorhabditis nigoni TaxID=1611254 RepID=A0A2G5TXM8_9PELO|nr:hypothetical protein B9Z55_012517 [Caenorhabditis nigoni]
MPSHRHLTAPIDRQILIAYEKLKNNSDRQAHSNLCQMILATPPPNRDLNCHEEDSDDENLEIKGIEKNGMDFETVFEMYSKLHRGANPKEEQSFGMTQEMDKNEVRKIANSLVLLAFANEESKLEDLKVTIGYGKVKFRLKMDGGKEKTEKTSESKGKTSENKDKICEYWRGIGGTWTWYQEVVTDENGTRVICDVRFVKDQKYQDLAASEFLSIFKHPTTKEQNRISFNTLEVDFEEYNGWDPKAYPFDAFFKKLDLKKPFLKVSKFIMKTYRKNSAEPQHLLRMLELLDPEGPQIDNKSKKSKTGEEAEKSEESGIDRIVLKLWNGSHLETGVETNLDITNFSKSMHFVRARHLWLEYPQSKFQKLKSQPESISCEEKNVPEARANYQDLRRPPKRRRLSMDSLGSDAEISSRKRRRITTIESSTTSEESSPEPVRKKANQNDIMNDHWGKKLNLAEVFAKAQTETEKMKQTAGAATPDKGRKDGKARVAEVKTHDDTGERSTTPSDSGPPLGFGEFHFPGIVLDNLHNASNASNTSSSTAPGSYSNPSEHSQLKK